MTTRTASSAPQMFATAALVVLALAAMPARADVKFNGLTLNGPVLQGPVLQGPIFQGPILQGPVFQGPALNAVKAPGRPGGFVAVTLPGGETIPLR